MNKPNGVKLRYNSETKNAVPTIGVRAGAYDWHKLRERGNNIIAELEHEDVESPDDLRRRQDRLLKRMRSAAAGRQKRSPDGAKYRALRYNDNAVIVWRL